MFGVVRIQSDRRDHLNSDTYRVVAPIDAPSDVRFSWTNERDSRLKKWLFDCILFEPRQERPASRLNEIVGRSISNAPSLDLWASKNIEQRWGHALRTRAESVLEG